MFTILDDDEGEEHSGEDANAPTPLAENDQATGQAQVVSLQVTSWLICKRDAHLYPWLLKYGI